MHDEGRTSLQLADEAMAAGDLDTAIVQLSAAVRGFTADGDNRSAALASARLGDLFHNVLGNRVAARSWFTRAMRLVEDEEPCVEQGWAAIAMIGCEVDDPDVLWQRAELCPRAGSAVRRHRPRDQGPGRRRPGPGAGRPAGRGHGDARRVDGPGLRRRLERSRALGKSVCSFYTACCYTADFERVASWSTTFRRRGIIDLDARPAACS